MTTRSSTAKFFKKSFFEMMKDVGTSIPGHILAFDDDTQLAQVQIGIVRVDVDDKGVKTEVVPQPLIECLVQFSGGNAFIMEHQVDPGDEGILIFSQRCIDEWVNSGGVASNPILRFHDINDCMFVPGLRSQPNKIGGFENNGIRMRNKEGTSYVWLKNDGTMAVKVSSMDVDGDITSTGTITGDVDVIAGTISGKTHKHAAGTLKDSVPAPVTGDTDTPS